MRVQARERIYLFYVSMQGLLLVRRVGGKALEVSLRDWALRLRTSSAPTPKTAIFSNQRARGRLLVCDLLAEGLREASYSSCPLMAKWRWASCVALWCRQRGPRK